MKSALNRIFSRSWARLRHHWLSVPTALLAVQFLGYVYFFSESGLVHYNILKKDKAVLVSEIAVLEKQKAELQQELGILSDDQKAMEKFSREFFLYPEKVTILKFTGGEPTEIEKQNKKTNFLQYQIWYFGISFASLLIVVFIFWHFRHREIPEDENYEI